jgi:hypothetical protein
MRRTFPQLSTIQNGKYKNDDEILKMLNSGSEDFFNIAYGSSAGNKDWGDGYKYRGRGPIQITGRANYEAVGKIIGVDLLNNPDLITKDVETASKAMVAYLAITLGGKSGYKKGLEIINSLKTPEEALKLILRAVAGLGHKESEFDTKGSHLSQQYAGASKYMSLANEATTGTQIDKSSSANRDMKADANAQQPAPVNVNNTYENKKSSPSSGGGGGSDDTNPYERKKNQ